MQPFDRRVCKAKNHWLSVAAHINHIQTAFIHSLVVCNKMYTHYWHPTLRFWVLSFASGCIVTSVSNGSKFPGWSRVRFHPNPDRGTGSYHTKNPDRRKWAGFTTKNPAWNWPFWLQFSIWVLIVSQHDQYVDCAVSVALSPPAFRMAIRQVFVESRSKTRRFRLKPAMISQPLNEYQSDRESESGRWNSDYICTIYVVIMLW